MSRPYPQTSDKRLPLSTKGTCKIFRTEGFATRNPNQIQPNQIWIYHNRTNISDLNNPTWIDEQQINKLSSVFDTMKVAFIASRAP